MAMNTVQLRDAKANLSKLVDAAERGESTTITRHGREVAVLVPIEEHAKAMAAARKETLEGKPDFFEFLKTFPIDLEELLGEDRIKIRDVEL
jgi:prevent-host-death family protein